MESKTPPSGVHVTIRPSQAGDAGVIARLSDDLGYPVGLEETAAFLSGLSDNHAVLVAEVGGKVVGWLECLAFQSVTTAAEALIVGLVVDESVRGQGIGARLVDAAEEWGRARGLSAIRVRSQEKRAEAHRFYENLGYERVKVQRVFRKTLNS